MRLIQFPAPARRHPLRASAGIAAAIMAFAALAPAASPAQSVSPPIAEYQERARSSFQLSNQSVFPLSVVLEVRGFAVTEEGEVQDTPLDTTRVRVKLSAMSFRIPPRGTYTVFYEAKADSLPAAFNILSALSGARTDAGVNVRLLLPHVVYLYQKQSIRREEVVVRAFTYDPVRKRARVQIENTGPRLGRVLGVALARGKTESPDGAAFPLFPFRRRWTELEWPGDSTPDRLAVRFAKFTLDTALTPAAPPNPGGTVAADTATGGAPGT